MTPVEHSLQNQLSSTHRGLHRLKQQSGSLCGSALGPLHACCACQLEVFIQLLTVGFGVSLTRLSALVTLFLLQYCVVQL